MSRQNRNQTYGWNAYTRSPVVHNDRQNTRRAIRRSIRALQRMNQAFNALGRATTQAHINLSRFFVPKDPEEQ